MRFRRDWSSLVIISKIDAEGGGKGWSRLFQIGGRGGPNFFIKKFQGSRVPAAHPHPNIPKVPPPDPRGISSLKEIQVHQK